MSVEYNVCCYEYITFYFCVTFNKHDPNKLIKLLLFNLKLAHNTDKLSCTERKGEEK